MSFCWSGFPAPFPGSFIFPALAGPGALVSGAPAVLAGDASAPERLIYVSGADAERDADEKGGA